jgi:hypothetical protein
MQDLCQGSFAGPGCDSLDWSREVAGTVSFITERSVYRFINVTDVLRFPTVVLLHPSTVILPLFCLSSHPSETRFPSLSFTLSGIHSNTCFSHLLSAGLWMSPHLHICFVFISLQQTFANQYFSRRFEIVFPLPAFQLPPKIFLIF